MIYIKNEIKHEINIKSISMPNNRKKFEIEKRKANTINLQQGEIRAKLEKQKTPFIINTRDGEAEIIGTEFAISDQGETQLWVTSGKVKLNRGEEESVFVEAGQRIDTESFLIEEKAGDTLIPNLYQGVEYFYYANPRESLSLDNDMRLIDKGCRKDFDYLTGNKEVASF